MMSLGNEWNIARRREWGSLGNMGVTSEGRGPRRGLFPQV